MTVTGEAEKGNGGRFRVAAKCDCGKEFECELRHLENGRQKSCGCSKIKHKLNDHPLAQVWRGMKNRCYSQCNNMYHRYGGRGIRVCKEWMDLKKFIIWAEENGYKEGLQIDRININGNYTPRNCRWVTTKQQQRNKINSRYISYNGRKMTVSELAEISEQPYDRVYQRLFRLGWSPEEAVR